MDKSITSSDAEDETSDEEVFEDIGEQEQSAFGQVELEEVWQKYARHFLSDKPRYSSLMLNYLPTLRSNYVVEVEVESSLQLDMFKEINADIVLFLRQKLENKTITVEVKKAAGDSSNGKLYTIEDKFKYLSQLNPSIVKLKQQLNLDFD